MYTCKNEFLVFCLHRKVCECVCTRDIVAMYAMFDHVCINLAMLCNLIMVNDLERRPEIETTT